MKTYTIIKLTIIIVLLTIISIGVFQPISSTVKVLGGSHIECNYLFANDIRVDGIRYSAHDKICVKHFDRELFNMILIEKTTRVGITYHSAHILPSN